MTSDPELIIRNAPDGGSLGGAALPTCAKTDAEIAVGSA